MQLDPLELGDKQPETDYTKNLDDVLVRFADQLLTIINKGIRIEDNLDVADKTVTTDATPGTETAIAHGLKRVPKGFLVYSQDKAASIYDGSTSNDATNLYLRSDVATVALKILIF